MAENFPRMLVLLETLPKAPNRLSPQQVRARMQTLGYDIDIRGIQRDLHRLSKLFPIEADRRSKPHGWYWSAAAVSHHLPRMNPAEALGYRLLSLYLDRLLPQSVLASLKPQMEAAERILENLPGGGLKEWTKKVRILSPGQALLLPAIQPTALARLYEALLTNRRVRARYRKAAYPKPWLYKELSPLALVLRGPVIYFLCTVGDYQDVLQFAAHRFREVEILDQAVSRPAKFDLNRYIEEHGFDFASGETIRLQLMVKQFLAVILEETPLSKDQKIQAVDNEWGTLTATVADTAQLRWWLLSFGDQVEVLGPPELRAEIRETSQAMAKRYERQT